MKPTSKYEGNSRIAIAYATRDRTCETLFASAQEGALNIAQLKWGGTWAMSMGNRQRWISRATIKSSVRSSAVKVMEIIRKNE